MNLAFDNAVFNRYTSISNAENADYLKVVVVDLISNLQLL